MEREADRNPDPKANKAQPLTASLLLWQRALAAVSNGILITDPGQEGNPIVYCNPGFERLTGYSADEILGRNCRFLQGPGSDPAAVARIRAAIQAGKGCQEVLLNYRKDGRPFWNELTISPLQDDQGRLTHFIGIQNDVTAQRESEQRLQAVFESALDAIIITDDSGRYIEVNPAACHLFGLTREQMLGRSPWDFVAPDQQGATRAAWQRFLLEGTQEGEFTLRRPDGAERVLEYRAKAHFAPGQHLSVLRDVTERITAEHARRASEVLFRALIENSSDMITVLETDGTIRYGSPSIERVLGYGPDELVGANVFDLLHPEDLAAVQAAFYAGLAAPGKMVLLELRFRHKNGSWRWLDSIGNNLLHEPAIRGIIVTSRDIHEIRQIHEEVRIGREQLKALSHRLVQIQEEERAQIARELHDEIGQLLTGIKLNLETGMRLPGQMRERVDRASALITDLVDRVRSMSLDLRPGIMDDLGLAPALEWYFERLRRQTGIHIEADIDPAVQERRFPAIIEITAFRVIQEALTNVMRHAGVSEAAVRLRTDYVLRIEIEDTGVGFERDDIMTYGRTAGLTGMAERATLAGGHITVDSTPGQGTRITVELPLS